MATRTLGKTDLRVSRVAMGTMTFGGQVNDEDSLRMVDYCLESGIDFFDTANIYNAGKSETVLGKALKGRRDKVIVATKAFFPMGPEPDDSGLKRAAIRKAIHESLVRLGTDYVDLYYLHQPDWGTRIEETLAAMDELVREGKIRYPAVSNYASWQILQMLWHCDNHGYLMPTVAQQMYNVIARGLDQEYLAFSKEFGVGLVVYNPLAGGLLSGKHQQGSAPAPGTRFDGNKMYQDRYWHPEYFEAVNILSQVARESGMRLVDLSLRWLLSQPQVDSVILGATRIEHLRENLKASEAPPLEADVLKKCDAVWEKLRGVVPKYNR